MGCVSPNVKEKKKVKLNIEKKINQEKENINNFEVLKNPNLKPILYIKSPFTFSRSNSMSNINVPFMDYKQIKPSNSSNYISQVSDITNLSIDTTINNTLSFNGLNQNHILSTNGILNIKILPTKFELMYQIWIEKNSIINFNICDNNNNNENQENKVKEDLLIGRVLNGKPFIIYDNLKYQSETNGPLFIKMNTKNNLNLLNKIESINLKIKGAKYIDSIYDLEKMIGWDNSIYDIYYVNSDDFKLSKNEKDIVIFINKIRVNSKLFAIQYLYNIQNLNKSSENVYKIFYENEYKFNKFKIDLSVKKIIGQYFKTIFNKENKNLNKKQSILKSDLEIKKILEEKAKKKNCKIFIKMHDMESSFSLVMRFIHDENIRNEILNKNNNELSLFINKLMKNNKIIYFTFLIFNEGYYNNNLNEISIKKVKISDLKKKIIESNSKSKLEIIKEEPVKMIDNLHSEVYEFNKNSSYLKIKEKISNQNE